MLNEICFLPDKSEAGFIELINVGSKPLSLDNLKLENEKGENLFFPEGQVIEPNAVFLIRFTSSENAEEGVLYLPDNDFLDAVSGQLMLLEQGGRLLDKVSWGANQAEPIKMGVWRHTG